MPGTPAVDWLRGLDDAALYELLRARPDLVVPAPASLDALARRLDTPTSVWRALETIDRFAQQVLQGLVVLGADHEPVTPAVLSKFLGRKAPKKSVAAALTALNALALARGGKAVQVPRSVAAALGAYPAGLGPTTGMTPESVAERLADCPERGRALLEKLAAGSPVGTVAPNAQIAPLVQDLIGRGLLLRRDSGTVELPREVGLALRGSEPLGVLQVDPVAPHPRSLGKRTVDDTAAGQALAATRIWRRLLELLGRNPPAVLKSGGLGIRDLRRLAKDIDATEETAALHLELLAAAGLIAPGDPRGTKGLNQWVPTSTADEWLAADESLAWATMVEIWLDLRRDPSRVGQRDLADRLMNVLATELNWLRGPADRRWVLSVLDELPSGDGLTRAEVAAILAWRTPLRAEDRRDTVIAQVLQDATDLGVIAFESITSAGRLLLAGAADEQVAAALTAALPAPTDRILVQADLTVIAAGRLLPELSARLGLAASVESAGSATVFRVTPESLRRAMDAGMTTAELHALFGDHSSTPIPQSLTYLIDDISRQHGVLRVGAAMAYLRCDDPVLIDTAIAHGLAAGVLLRRIAPTVAVSRSPMEEVIFVLRAAGLAPSGEDNTGAIMDLVAAPQRTRAGLVLHQRWREPADPDEAQLNVLISRMRSADRARSVPGQHPNDALAMLREAAFSKSAVWVEYVNTEGASTRRLIEPLAISGGSVAAFDRLSQQMRNFSLHRISGIQPADDTDRS